MRCSTAGNNPARCTPLSKHPSPILVGKFFCSSENIITLGIPSEHSASDLDGLECLYFTVNEFNILTRLFDVSALKFVL